MAIEQFRKQDYKLSKKKRGDLSSVSLSPGKMSPVRPWATDTLSVSHFSVEEM